VFAPVDYPPDIPIEPMSVDQALTLLKAHLARVHRLEQRPRPRPPGYYEKASEAAFARLEETLDRCDRRVAAGAVTDAAGARRIIDRGARAVRGG
jgi:hypothetical protein